MVGYSQNGGAKVPVDLHISKSADEGATWSLVQLDTSDAPPDCSYYFCGWAYLGAQITMIGRIWDSVCTLECVIHEVRAARPELWRNLPSYEGSSKPTIPAPRTREETSPQIKPKVAVYTHNLLFSGEGAPEVTTSDIIARTRKTYSGPLEAGEDLMSISIADTVTVQLQLH